MTSGSVCVTSSAIRIWTWHYFSCTCSKEQFNDREGDLVDVELIGRNFIPHLKQLQRNLNSPQSSFKPSLWSNLTDGKHWHKAVMMKLTREASCVWDWPQGWNENRKQVSVLNNAEARHTSSHMKGADPQIAVTTSCKFRDSKQLRARGESNPTQSHLSNRQREAFIGRARNRG